MLVQSRSSVRSRMLKKVQPIVVCSAAALTLWATGCQETAPPAGTSSESATTSNTTPAPAAVQPDDAAAVAALEAAKFALTRNKANVVTEISPAATPTFPPS